MSEKYCLAINLETASLQELVQYIVRDGKSEALTELAHRTTLINDDAFNEYEPLD